MRVELLCGADRGTAQHLADRFPRNAHRVKQRRREWRRSWNCTSDEVTFDEVERIAI